MNHRIDDVERNYYRILGVDRQSSLDELRAAHRKLARMLHPDAQAGNSGRERELAERRMREVNEAWSVLSDLTERANYDEALAAAELRDAAARAVDQGGGSSAGQCVPGRSGSRNGPLPNNFDNADPVFRRAFQELIDDDGSGHPGGGGIGPLHFDADEMTDEERRRLNIRSTVIVVALVVVVAVFLVVTAYAGGVSDPSPTVGPTTNRVGSTIEPED